MADDSRLTQPRFLFRRYPVEDGGRHHRFFPQGRVPGRHLFHHIEDGFAGGDFIIHQNHRIRGCQPRFQGVAAQLLFHSVAVLLLKFQKVPVTGAVLPGGLYIETVPGQLRRRHRADGRGRLGKADDQPGRRIGLPQGFPQGFHQRQRRFRVHRQVLGLQGIDQQIGPFCVAISFCNAQNLFHGILLHVIASLK